LDHEVILCILVQMRFYKWKIIIHGFWYDIEFNYGEKRRQVYILELIYELWNQLWVLIKKIPSLVNLIASIISNDSYGVKNYNY